MTSGDYIYKRILNKKDDEDEKLFIDFGRLLRDLGVKNRKQILNLVRMHLFTDTISFPVFYNCLNTLYYYEFFFKVKSPAFIQKNEQSLVELFKNQWEFSNFLSQTGHMYSIAVYLIIDHILLKKSSPMLAQVQKKSLKELENKASALLDMARYSIGEVKGDIEDDYDKEAKLIYAMFFVSRMYFTIEGFLKEFINREGSE